MKTILIPIYQAVEVKNILRTGVVKTFLADPNVRIVCIVRYPERIEHYQRELPYERITYDAYYAIPRGVLERLFSMLKFHIIRTQTTDLKRRLRYEAERGFMKYKFGVMMSWLLSHKAVRNILRFFDYRVIGDPGYKSLLQKHQPDVVFLAHLFDDAQVSLLRETQKMGIPSVGFINSWDKLTARCALRLLPETLIVYNQMVKEEAIAHADMPEEKIRICGIPQYDQYLTEKPISREAFFTKIGLDATRPMILYAPQGETYSASDWEMIDYLQSAIDKGVIGKKAQLFVRFQPNDFITESELEKRPWLKYDRPGIRYGSERGGDWDMTFADLAHLRDTLAHTALLVCHPSSLSVDAAIMKKPVINIGFELKPQSNPMKATSRYYAMEHYRKVLDTGGIRVVKNKEDLLSWINTYLEDTSRDAPLREALVRQQLPEADGKSGERTAAVVLQVLGKSNRES